MRERERNGCRDEKEQRETKRTEKEREVVTERWVYMEKLDYRMKMRTSIL